MRGSPNSARRARTKAPPRRKVEAAGAAPCALHRPSPPPPAGSGGALRFLGEGVSVVNRRDLFGISLAPNLSFTRIDLSARFKAVLPLVYLPKRRSWKLESGFKIELLQFKREASSAAGAESEYAPEKLLRLLMQAVIEGMTRHLLMGQLGPHLGAYLKAARHGAEVVVDVSVRGIPVRTFDADLSGGGEAAADAARLLGISRAQVEQLVAVQRLVRLDSLPSLDALAPSLGASFTPASFTPAAFTPELVSRALRTPLAASTGAAPVSPTSHSSAAAAAGTSPLPFRSLAEVLRYFNGARRAEPLRSEIVALWQEALYALQSEEQPADVELLLERIEALQRKPAQVVLRCLRLDLELEPEKLLGAIADAIAAQLASNSAGHGSASAALDTFRAEARSYLASLRTNMHRVSVSVSGALRGGGDGTLSLSVPRALYEGTASISRLLSPPRARPFALLSSMRADGRLEVVLSLLERLSTSGGSTGDATEERGGATPSFASPSQSPTHAPTAPAAAGAQPAGADGVRGLASRGLEVLRTLITKATGSLLVGSNEVLRACLLPQVALDGAGRPPPAPSLPPLPSSAANVSGEAVEADDSLSGGGGTGAALSRGGGGLGDAGGGAGGGDASISGLAQRAEERGGAALAPASLASGSKSPPPSAAGDAALRRQPVSRRRQMRTVEVYENERRLTVLRKYSADDLFPLDYSHYSDEYGTQRWSSLEEVPLPDGDGWRWASPFRVDYDGGNKNDEGWQFGIHFNTGWLSASNALTHVRRRRWIRDAEYAPPLPPPPPPPPPLPAAAAAAVAARASPVPAACALEGGAAGGADGRSVEPRREGGDRGEGGTRSSGGEGGPGRSEHHGELNGAGALALLQLSIADGARLRLSVEGVEMSGRPLLLAEQVAAVLLDQNLAVYTWYREPLMIALDRISRHLHSPKLRIQHSLLLNAASTGEPGSFTIHMAGADDCEDESAGAAAVAAVAAVAGVAEDEAAEAAEVAPEPGGIGVLVFRNEINLMDFVTDMHDIYTAFATNITAQSSYAVRPGESATGKGGRADRRSSGRD